MRSAPEQPRPERSAARRLVVLVVASGRVRRAAPRPGRSSWPPRRHRCGRARRSPPRPSRRRRRSRARCARDRSPSPRRSGSGRTDPWRARAGRRSRGRAGTSGRCVEGGDGRLREVLHRDLDGRLAGEGHRPGQQLVEDDPGRVEVRRLVDGGAARLLGGEVLRRADDRARLGHLARGAGARDAEVHHLDATLAVDDHVVRLDVAVHDPVPVREAQRREDLARVVDRDPERRRDRARRAAPSASGPRCTPSRCSRCPRSRRGRRSRRCSGARARRRSGPRDGTAPRTARRWRGGRRGS